MELTIESAVEMSHGRSIPVLGLGVYQTGAGAATRNAVRWALEAGYRHVDTAALYENEREVGDAIRESGIVREDVFVTTKLWNSDHGYDRALGAFDRSLERLGFEYVDLYLIHWPVEGIRHESWRALERLLDDGRARAIGVSNYTVRHLEELLGRCHAPPAVNQVEFSPFLYQRKLLDYCAAHRVVLEAYSPLTKSRRLRDPRLLDIAAGRGRSAAQILIRWSLQRGLVVIPKSADRNRIAENASVFDFELDAGEMARLDSLDENLHTSWDPSDVP